MAYLYGTSGRDRLIGTNDRDEITGFSGADILIGGDGDDILYGDDQRTDSGATGGTDYLRGGAGRDVLVGGAGDDTLEGGDGDDVLLSAFAGYVLNSRDGFGYSYTSFGDGGNDTIDGGSGLDRAILLYDRSAGVSVNISDATRTSAIVSGGVQIGAITGVEGMQFYGGVGADRAIGGDSYDELVGRWGDDHLEGGAAGDFLNGGMGDDYLDGGAGIDVVSYDGALSGITIDLRLQGTAQNTGGAGTDILFGIERLEGSRFTDIMVGDDGANEFRDNFDGDDRIAAGAGNDSINIYRGFSAIAGTASTVTIAAGAGDDDGYLGGGGNARASAVFNGEDGNDVLFISDMGSVRASMGRGDDIVYAEVDAGRYALSLGSGTDTLVLSGALAPDARFRPIEVKDFEAGAGGDRVDVGIWLVNNVTGYESGTDPFRGGYMRLREVAGTTYLEFDRDAGGTAFGWVRIVAFAGTAVADFDVGNFGPFDPTPARAEPPHDFSLLV